MRIFACAAVAAAMILTVTSADAQRYPPPPGMPAPMPGAPGGWNGGNWNGGRPAPLPGPRSSRGRWGSRINGYWYAGVQAPGGWNGYRQMRRGRTLPRYWTSPSFFIDDFGTYGLQAPLPGYYWTRYYNDAVMADRYGHVYDSVGGIDWDRYGGYDDGYADAGPDYDSPGYGASYPPPGGPVVYPPVGYNGSTLAYYSSTTGGYAGPGYVGGTYMVGPGTIATVTVPGAVTTTTTTQEIIEEYAPRPTVVVKRVYRRAAPRKRVWRPRPRPLCGCGS